MMDNEYIVTRSKGLEDKEQVFYDLPTALKYSEHYIEMGWSVKIYKYEDEETNV